MKKMTVEEFKKAYGIVDEDAIVSEEDLEGESTLITDVELVSEDITVEVKKANPNATAERLKKYGESLLK